MALRSHARARNLTSLWDELLNPAWRLMQGMASLPSPAPTLSSRHLSTGAAGPPFPENSTAGDEPLFQPFLGNMAWEEERTEVTTRQAKDHLLEKYNSPALMSAMERHKLQLQRVRREFQRHESDSGSSEVQIALLTDKIKHVAEHMKQNHKDFHSRKGLEGMVAQRRRLLKYLRRSDWDAYCQTIARLGLRDRLDSAQGR